eukprot:TRINITY_DN21093_c0_g1_i1.p1 TRINITY_DN21093_c0_g1~~TRINITY_DN21093_c0_g1_i1.p1  ORF type:complete len:438 (-),score=30.07 TRINITY_DN21093_c0_g1_i1:86-1333(-)
MAVFPVPDPPCITASPLCGRVRTEVAALSKPQRRRRRLQRAAVRHAMVNTQHVLETVPCLSHLEMKKPSLPYELDMLLGRLRDILPLLHSILLPTSSCTNGDDHSDGGMDPMQWMESTMSHMQPIEAEEFSRLNPEADAFVPRPPEALGPLQAPWEPMPFLSRSDAFALQAVSRRHAQLCGNVTTTSSSLPGFEIGRHGMTDESSASVFADTCAASACVDDVWITREPLRPTSAYFMFVAERRPQIIGSPIEVSKQLNAEWTDMDARRRKKFCDKYDVSFQEYERRLDEFKRFGRYRQHEIGSQIDTHALPSEDLRVENAATARRSPDEREFSHGQFLAVVDMTIREIEKKVGLTENSLDDVASHVKGSFPADPSTPPLEAVFSRNQVKRVIELVTERCEQILRSRCTASNGDSG